MVPLTVRVLHRTYRPILRRAAFHALEGRQREDLPPSRWLPADVDAFLTDVWSMVDQLLPVADLARLPSFGTRHNAFLALVTTAAYRVLLDRGLAAPHARELVSDMGWKVYRWMLTTALLPFRALRMTPEQRMKGTLRLLLRFPFEASKRPAYEARAWSDGAAMHTIFTHCPPLEVVRRIVSSTGDRGDLKAFRSSWCQYDWAAADLIAGDGSTGHYERPHTLSNGDPVCDMRWSFEPLVPLRRSRNARVEDRASAPQNGDDVVVSADDRGERIDDWTCVGAPDD